MKPKEKLSGLGRCSGHFYDSILSMDSEGVKDILDIGCGRGRTFYLLDRFQEARRFGLDININELRKAKEKCFASLGSGLSLPFKQETFDLIVEFHTFHHIPEYAKAINEVARCLKKGGHFLMVEAVNDNPLFRFFRDKHPIARHMPIESNFMFNELIGSIRNSGLEVRSAERFGILLEFTLGGIPGMPAIIKRAASAVDGFLERFMGTKYCASCVVLSRKETG